MLRPFIIKVSVLSYFTLPICITVIYEFFPYQAIYDYKFNNVFLT